MPFNVPTDPAGPSKLAAWLKRLKAAARAAKVLPGLGYKVKYTPAGTILEVQPASSGGAGAKRFRVKSVQGDYLTCRTWNGTTEGAADVLIAKPPQLRHSVTAQTIAGVSVNYGTFAISSGLCSRVASASGYDDQTEYVLPVWQIAGTSQDSEVWAFQPSSGTGVEGATWIDLNVDARAWCEVFPTPLL